MIQASGPNVYSLLIACINSTTPVSAMPTIHESQTRKGWPGVDGGHVIKWLRHSTTTGVRRSAIANLL